MKVLFLAYNHAVHLHKIQEAINKNPMKCHCEDNPKECATCDYSEHHNKFIFHKDCPVTIKDMHKKTVTTLGNGISKGSINKKLCCWIVFKGGSDVSRTNIETICKLIKTEEIKKRHK